MRIYIFNFLQGKNADIVFYATSVLNSSWIMNDWPLHKYVYIYRAFNAGVGWIINRFMNLNLNN